MKTVLILALALAASAGAHAAKPCEELKGEIAAKLEGKGVKGFTLEIVAPDQAGDRRVVGSCEGGKKKIVYSRK